METLHPIHADNNAEIGLLVVIPVVIDFCSREDNIDEFSMVWRRVIGVYTRLESYLWNPT
jgi:hypothetical protein